VAALRDFISVAVPTLRGDCLDVSRGLRARGIQSFAFGRWDVPFLEMAERALSRRVGSRHDCSHGLAQVGPVIEAGMLLLGLGSRSAP
jgi:hypothetical protein